MFFPPFCFSARFNPQKSLFRALRKIYVFLFRILVSIIGFTGFKGFF